MCGLRQGHMHALELEKLFRPQYGTLKKVNNIHIILLVSFDCHFNKCKYTYLKLCFAFEKIGKAVIEHCFEVPNIFIVKHKTGVTAC